MSHIDYYLFESLIVFALEVEDFSNFTFLVNAFTMSVSIDHRQCCFLLEADFLPPKMYSFEPITVTQCPAIPFSILDSFINGF